MAAWAGRLSIMVLGGGGWLVGSNKKDIWLVDLIYVGCRYLS